MSQDGLREYCGVAGIYNHSDAAELIYYCLFALQHRGQESAGIAVTDGQVVDLHCDMGLVSEVFGKEEIASLTGEGRRAAVGHVRYSTTGASMAENAQPLVIRYRGGALALCHNGNLVNAGRLRLELEEQGSIFRTTSDTEVIAHLMARFPGDDAVDALVASLNQVIGGYALVIMTRDRLLGARDPHGIRPLVLGRRGDAYVLASETCALNTIGAEYVRDVEAGEVVAIGADGITSRRLADPDQEGAAVGEHFCIFEYIYFARPDSDLRGTNVHLARKELGRVLARNHPAAGDIVTGVPDSSISAASGYAEEAGIPYEMGLIKNRYTGRTFIQPNQKLREQGAKLKYIAIPGVVSGKRVILVDDSIVRGTTSRHLVSLLRDAGATEVHMRISSPPYRWPCHYGIATANAARLIAARMTVEEIQETIGADSLHYLDLEEVKDAVGRHAGDFCTACFSGDYPTPIDDVERDREIIEAVERVNGG